MPVVVTPNIGLTEPEVNVSTGWGGTLNTNFTLIDNIFASNGTGTSVGMNVGTGKVLTIGGSLVMGVNDGTASAAAPTAIRGAAKTGTNAVGPDVTIQSGNGTGSGGSGSVKIQTAPAGASGTTADTMQTVLEARNTGVVSFPVGVEVAGVGLTDLLPPTGTIVTYVGTTAPSGWLLASGLTIGNASSNATARANADTVNLFTLLWNSFSNTELPIQTSTGSASTRGASAAADYAANKRLPLPDLRGRVPVGKDNMGGTTAGRITAAVSGITGTTLGSAGGAEGVTLSTSQIPAHQHFVASDVSSTAASLANNSYMCVNANFGGNSAYSLTGVTSPAATLGLTSSTGGGGSHTNTQPAIILNMIIKL